MPDLFLCRVAHPWEKWLDLRLLLDLVLEVLLCLKIFSHFYNSVLNANQMVPDRSELDLRMAIFAFSLKSLNTLSEAHTAQKKVVLCESPLHSEGCN